ncbi:MAG: CRISPR-associated ring nuclease [Candidatus Heimdallarchaeota archaeon]
MGRESVLLISLGRSPAVVTETVDALLDRGIRPKRVYLVTTGDETILNECIPLLRKEFDRIYKPKGIELRPYDCILSQNDIYTAEDNIELMGLVAGLLKREQNNDILLSMAGGRKTMSAAMALLAQIYNVKAITHVLVPPEIEAEGNIWNLLKISEPSERAKILHPEERRLIFFPVIGISWMLNDMIRALRGEVKDVRISVLETLKTSGLLDEENHPTLFAQELLKILEDIESFPMPSSLNPAEKIKISHPENLPKSANKFIQKLANIPFVTKIRDIEFINSSESRVREPESDGSIICQYSDKQKAVKLHMSTTAPTRGQARWIQRAIISLVWRT